jgi:hypothetical protein
LAEYQLSEKEANGEKYTKLILTSQANELEIHVAVHKQGAAVRSQGEKQRMGVGLRRSRHIICVELSLPGRLYGI